jgi:PAS domain S-box-containing protein
MSEIRPEYKPGSFPAGLKTWNQIIIRISLSLVFLTGLLGLLGGILNLPVLSSFSPYWIQMKIITSICIILSGIILILVRHEVKFKWKISLARVLATFVILVSIITIFQYYHLSSTGFEADMPIKLFFDHSNIMAFVTALILFFTSSILVLLSFNNSIADNFAHILIWPVAFASYFIPVSYLLGLPNPYEIMGVPVALSTGIAFCGSCIAIIFGRPDTWLMKVLTGNNIGGVMARRLIPAIFILPIIIAWMRINGERSMLFPSEVGVALVALTYTICFIILIWFTARSISKIDERRRHVEEELIKSRITESERKRFNDVLEILPAYIILLTPDYHVSYANRYFRERFGDSGGRRCFEFLFNRTEACEVCETYKSLNENRSLTWEWTGPDKRIYSIFDFPFSDSDGSPMIMEMGIDVTSLKEAQADLLKMNASLEQRVADRTRDLKINSERLKILSETSSRLLQSGNPQLLIDELCNKVMKFLDCHVFFNFLVDEKIGKLHLNSFAGIPDSTTREIEWLNFGEGVSSCVANDGERIIAENIQDTPDPRTEPIKSFGVKAYACHPLLSGEKVIGTLSFGTKSRSGFNPEEISLMKTVSDEVAIALNRQKHEDDLRTSLDELSKLNRTLNSLGRSGKVMMHSTDEQQYLEAVCRIIVEDCGHTMVWIGYAQNDVEKNVIPVAYSGFEAGYLQSLKVTWSDTDRGRGPTGTTIRTGKVSICTDMQKDPAFEPWRDEAIKRGYASSIVLPLTKEGRAFGALSIYSKEINPFSSEEINLLSEIANDLAYGITHIRLTTSEKKAIALIRESEEKFRQLFESMTEGFALHEIVQDKEGKPVNYRFLSVNPAFERMTGLKANLLTGRLVTEVLPGTEKYWIDTYGKVALTGENIEFENYSGDLGMYFKVNAFSPRIGFFATIFENITERIVAEKALRSSGEKLNLALQNGNIGTWEWDIPNERMEWDERMEAIFGVDAGSFNGTWSSFEKCLAEEDVSHVNKAFTDALDKSIPFDTVYRITKNGSMNYISSKALVTRNSNGNPVKISGVCFDITEMKKGAEHALFKLNENLLRSNRELEQFAYVASHDLQEPLRMVSSFTQLLELRYHDKLDDDARDFIGFAVDGAIRMQNLINDLLEFSRIETKGDKFRTVNMNEVLKHSSNNLKISINESHAHVTSDNLPVLSADEGQMVQLFQNLIGNALKFCTKSPKVHISSSEEADHYLFSVKDNGIGIEPQYFNKIFKIFQRLLPKDQYEGTGIGLAICKRIVERHGGRIWVESKPDSGSVFYFTINKTDKAV